MKTFTRSSFFTTSSVGPSRFASTAVRVFVSARWTFRCSSGEVVSSGPGRGAWIASGIAETLLPRRRLRTNVRNGEERLLPGPGSGAVELVYVLNPAFNGQLR